MGTHPIFESDFDCLTENARPSWLFVYSLSAKNGRDCKQQDGNKISRIDIVSEMHESQKNAYFWRPLLRVSRFDNHPRSSCNEQKNVQPPRVQQKTGQASASACSSWHSFRRFSTLDIF